MTPATEATPNSPCGLIGDIGSTNARFALVRGNEIDAVRLYALGDYASVADVIEQYLKDQKPTAVQPEEAVLAVAGPITGDEVSLTNNLWSFSIEALQQRLAFRQLQVINDFTAVALAIPHLRHADCVQIGTGAATADAPAAVIGPGTGLGVSAYIPSAGGAVTISGEGGHATMSPATEVEADVLKLMRGRYDHVSAERVLSGPGLVNLYTTLCELANVPAAPLTPAQITSPHVWKEDIRAREATAMFCGMLGTVAGNVALTFGARAGVYLAGGIVPKIIGFFEGSEFRARFEAKGRLQQYLAAIPTFVVVRPLPGLIGAASMLKLRQQG